MFSILLWYLWLSVRISWYVPFPFNFRISFYFCLTRVSVSVSSLLMQFLQILYNFAQFAFIRWVVGRWYQVTRLPSLSYIISIKYRREDPSHAKDAHCTYYIDTHNRSLTAEYYVHFVHKLVNFCHFWKESQRIRKKKNSKINVLSLRSIGVEICTVFGIGHSISIEKLFFCNKYSTSIDEILYFCSLLFYSYCLCVCWCETRVLQSTQIRCGFHQQLPFQFVVANWIDSIACFPLFDFYIMFFYITFNYRNKM